ncbi:MAG TPA: hypothetical protein VFL51_12560 [Pseudolabrys sp.]|nr:hypothetical protein [Pseudolabrys sp.]
MRGCAIACLFTVATALPPAAAAAQDAGAPPAAATSPTQAGPAADDAEFWSRLDLDPVQLDAPTKPVKAPHSMLENKNVDVTRTENADGSASVSINKSLAAPWGARVGSDLGYSDTPSPDYDPTRPLPGASSTDQSRAVWANVAVPEVGSVNARIDSNPDQRKYGTSIARSILLGRRLSVTAQDSYSVTESFGAPAMSPATTRVSAAPPQAWGNNREVKLNVLPTGTTFGAAWSNAAGDPVTHNTFSADQKLYGSLHVTTSVTDVGEPTASKSVTAGFKMNW